MDKSASQNSAVSLLYPPVEPFDQGMMNVGDGHCVYFEQCGNPMGVPVVVLHGGPGGGCSPAMRRFFDPSVYRIILFDQRGCGRSTPHASVENNTTWHLVADIERIRAALGIEKWIVFGGSWGATLSLLYAQTHPDRAAYLTLRGVFLMTQAELRWFYGGGAASFWPEKWDEFEKIIPEHERDDLIKAYHRRLFSDDLEEQTRYARAWSGWEGALAVLEPSPSRGTTPAAFARAFARLENHYFVNAGFLARDSQVLDDVTRIAHIEGTIVQGRYDMICPPAGAAALAQRWPLANLRMIPTAGHALSEPSITAALVETMDGLRNRFDDLGF